jgi:hypothetical protein
MVYGNSIVDHRRDNFFLEQAHSCRNGPATGGF